MGRWKVMYGDKKRGDRGNYVVTDGQTRIQFDRKRDAIAESQKRNDYEPIDGSEATYAEQIKVHDAQR
jgi:hypothetical protein